MISPSSTLNVEVVDASSEVVLLATRIVSPPLAFASSSTVVAVESSDVADAACSG